MIGVASTTAGTVTVNGGTLNVGSQLFVGGNAGNPGGNSTFIMTNGVVSATSFLAANSSTSLTLATASVNISGGQLNVNNGTFQLARFGTASMLLSGGTVNLSGTTGFLVTNGSLNVSSVVIDGGTLLMGTGTVNVSRSAGVGSILIKSGYVAFPATPTNGVSMMNNAGGTASLLIQGGTVTAGTINVSQAAGAGANTHLIMSQADPNIPTELSVIRIRQANDNIDLQFNGGTLTIGTVGYASNGPGVYNGGTLSPGTAGVAGGGADFGTTNMPAVGGGNFTNFIQGVNHHLHIDVGDAGAKDFVSITVGSAQLNGTLDVNYKDSNPQLNAVYDVLTAAGGLGGILPTLVNHTPGLTFSEAIVNSGTTLELTVTGVPEPATLGITGIGLIALLHRRPRRRGNARAVPTIDPMSPPMPGTSATPIDECAWMRQ